MSAKTGKKIKPLAFCVLIPILLTAAAIYLTATTAPSSVNPDFRTFSDVKGYPVGWWRSIQFQQSSPWSPNPYLVYDQGALAEDVAIFYVIFTVIMVVIYKIFYH
jgi:hypothetical protein